MVTDGRVRKSNALLGFSSLAFLCFSVCCPVFGGEALRKADVLARRAALGAAAEKEVRRLDIVKNGKFAEGSAGWEAHLCKIEGGVARFARTQPEYTQLRQTRPAPFPAGTALLFEADLEVSDPYGVLNDPKAGAQIGMAFRKADRTVIWGDNPAGKATGLKLTDGKTATFSLSMTVPEGAETVEIVIKSALPVQIVVHAMRLFAPVTRAAAERLGLDAFGDAPGGSAARADTRPAAERARDFLRANELHPVVLGKTVTVDGDPSDWDDVPWTGRIDQIIPRFAPPANPADAGGRFKAAMDADFLYLLVEIDDDRLNFGASGNHEDDSVEIYLSPTLNQQGRAPTDVQMVVGPKDGKLETFNLAGSDYGRFFTPEVAGMRREGGWGFETAIPLRNGLFEFFPSDGVAMGFNLAYNDNDSGRRDHKLSWYPDPEEKAWRDFGATGCLVVLSDEALPYKPARATVTDERPAPETFSFENNRPGTLNLLVNGDFSRGDRGWTGWFTDGTSFTPRPDGGPGGGPFLAVDGGDMEPGAQGARVCANAFNVLPGEKYRVSFHARARAPRPVTVQVTCKNEFYRIVQVGAARLPEDGTWKGFEYDFTVPDVFRDEQGVAQLMFSANSGGGSLDLAEVRLVRYTPAEVDAWLGFDRSGYSLAAGSDASARLRLRNAGPKAAELLVEAVVTDVFTRTPAGRREVPVTLPPEGTVDLDLPMPTGTNGLFRLRVAVNEPATKRRLLRQTEFAVFRPAAEAPAWAGVCIGHHIYLPDSAAAIVDAMIPMGIRSVRVFVHRTQEYREGRYDFSALDRLVDALAARGATTVACVNVLDRRAGRSRVERPEVFERYLRELVRHFKGRIEVYEVGNEVNLWMGWPPDADPREYAALLRLAYNVIRQEDPSAKVGTSGFNRANLTDYYRTFLEMNRGNFYDVFTFHPYEVNGNPAGTRGLFESMDFIRRFGDGVPVYDTESGSDKIPQARAVATLAKKIPVYRQAGVARHYQWGMDRMASGHMWSLYGSPGACGAVYAFLSDFYPDRARVLGAWTKRPGFSVYVSEADGRQRTAVWREGSGDGLLELPAGPGVRVHDVFGNDVTARHIFAEGVLRLSPPRDWPLYVTGTTLPDAELEPPPSAPPADRREALATDVLLLPERPAGFFTLDLPAGERRGIPVLARNFSDTPKRVELAVRAPDGVTAAFERREIVLPPGGTERMLVHAEAGKTAEGVLVLGGAVDGLPLAGLPVAVRAGGDLRFSVRGRRVEIRNSTNRPITGALHAMSNVLDLVPYRVPDLEIAPGATRSIPFELRTSLRVPDDGRLPTTLTFVDSGGVSHLHRAEFSLAVARSGAPAPDGRRWFDEWTGDDPVRLGDADGAFGASFKVRWRPDRLYVAVRVRDDSPGQDREDGFLGDADAVIVGVDPDASAETGFDDDAFEAGFARTDAGQNAAYRWNGRFGLESAKPFPEARYTIERVGDLVYYNLEIPVPAPLKAGSPVGFSLLAADRTAEGGRRTLSFGGGLEGARDAGAFASLLLR